MVDVTDIYNLKYTMGGNFSEYHLSFAKWAPLAPPRVVRSLVDTSSYLTKGIFQFRYRYVYSGGFKSTWSPPSFFATNEITGQGYLMLLYIPGYIFDFETPANTAFGHSSIKFYDFVDSIELAYRESSIDTWKIFNRTSATSSVVISFKNNGPIARVPSAETRQYFDAVPFEAGCCEAIDNRPMFGDNLDDLEVSDFDVEGIAVYTSNAGATNWNGGTLADFTLLSSGERTALGQLVNIKQLSFKEGGIYKMGIIFQHWTGRTGLVNSLDKWTYLIPYRDNFNPGSPEDYHALGFNIPSNINPPDWAVAYQLVVTRCLNIDFFIHAEVNDVVFLTSDANGLDDDINTPDSIKSTLGDYYNYYNPASTNLPLSARILNDIRKTKVAASVTLASWIYFDIRNFMLSSAKDLTGTSDNPSNSIYYNFQQGDRLRFTGIQGVVDTTYDQEIITYTGNGVIVQKPSGLTDMKTRSTYVAPGGRATSNSYFLVEIYRPRKFNEEDDVIFHEIGEWYPITQPTTVSRDFSKRDFRWTSASAVTVSDIAGQKVYQKMPISNGDVWIVNKSFYYKYVSSTQNGVSAISKWMQMNQDPTKAALSWDHNEGRELPAYKYIPTTFQKETQIRFGNRYLEDSLFMAFNTFRDENQFIYAHEYGRIYAMVNTSNAQVESVGSILLVLGALKPWSIYVNRTTLEDLSGRTQVAISDKVLGSFNTLLGDYGCMNPESVSVRRGRLMYWSARKGSWVRYSRDGLTAVSDNKMKNWFKDLGDLMLPYYTTTGQRPRALSVFDDYHGEWVTYLTWSAQPATFRGYDAYRSISFSENDKRWKTVFDYEPDLFAALDNETYSISGYKVRIHEEGTDFGKVYGVAKPSELEFVANSMPRRNKIWKSVDLQSSDGWSFESIKGDWRSNSATIQESRIPLTSLQLIEGRYVADIPRDMNTPNGISETRNVVDGNVMRSRALTLKLKLDPAVDYLSVFNWLIVMSDDSAKNVKN
jgi:hypothetical protein